MTNITSILVLLKIISTGIVLKHSVHRSQILSTQVGKFISLFKCGILQAYSLFHTVVLKSGPDLAVQI